jgi:hypothetical protein
MNTIIIQNANEILSLLMNLFPKINGNQFFKNQIKMMIYLYLTDVPESISDPLFYSDSRCTKALIKYARFIETQMTCYEHSINENNECIFLNNTNDDIVLDFCNTSFSTVKPKKQKKIIILHDRTNFTNYEDKTSFATQFMKPHRNFSGPVSIKIFDTMVKINIFEEDMLKYKNIVKDTSFSNSLFHISMIQNNILRHPLSNNPTITDVDKHTQLISDLNKQLFIYNNDLHRQKDAHLHLSSSLKNQKHFEFLKHYCQNTVLLDLHKMVSVLNDDILNYIKSFIHPSFLENIRRYSIRNKYFLFPRQTIWNFLNKLSVKHIKLLCCNHLSLLYNLNSFYGHDNLNQISDHSLFMNYYHLQDSHLLFDSNILHRRSKKKIIKFIINNNDIIHSFDFLRDSFFIHKFFS